MFSGGSSPGLSLSQDKAVNGEGYLYSLRKISTADLVDKGMDLSHSPEKGPV